MKIIIKKVYFFVLKIQRLKQTEIINSKMEYRIRYSDLLTDGWDFPVFGSDRYKILSELWESLEASGIYVRTEDRTDFIPDYKNYSNFMRETIKFGRYNLFAMVAIDKLLRLNYAKNPTFTLKEVPDFENTH